MKIFADQLQQFVGCELDVDSCDGRYRDSEPEGLDEWAKHAKQVSSHVAAICAKGKFMWWQLSNDWSIWITHGMSGTWKIDSLHPKHVAVTFLLSPEDSGARVVSFVDPRHFGTVKFVKGKDTLDAKLATLGFPFLDREQSTTAIWWFIDAHPALLEQQVGVVLLNQRVFCGVGNYIRAEALYAARLSPFRLLKDVSWEEFDALCKAVRRVMVESYERNGASFKTHLDAEGKKGRYTSCLAVYGKKTDPEGRAVSRDKTSDGRTIHYVKEIQR